MSWLPSLLSPAAAAIAASIALPSLLLLYFLKLRRKPAPISSTLLWKKAVQDMQVNSPFQRLRRNLLLLLQLLLIGSLIFALARPVSRHRATAGQVNIILIDRSASMSAKDADGRTRLDEAKRQAIDLVNSMPRGAQAMVIAFDDSAEVIQTFSSDAQQLRAAIESITPSDRLTRLKTAYTLAEAAMQIDPEQLRAGTAAADIHVYSDGRVLDSGELSTNGNVRFYPIGSDQTDNLAIVACSARRNYDRPTEVQGFVRLANFGPQPAKADVVLSLATFDENADAADQFESRFVRETATLAPSRRSDQERRAAESQGLSVRDAIEFKLDLTSAAVLRVELKSDSPDALPADDVAYVVVPPPKSLSLVLVTDGNYYLSRAVESLGLQRTSTLTPAAYEANVPADADVIIFDRHSPTKLPPSGSFVYVDALPPGTALKQSADDAGVNLFAVDTGVLDWKREHPLVRGLNLARIFASRAMKLDLPIEAETIVEGVDGPLVVLYRQSRSTHLVISFDLLQSNWPLQQTFPIFVFNTMQFLAAASELNLRESLVPGDAPRLPRANLDRVGQPKSITLFEPTGERREVEVPETGDVALPPLERVGVYRTRPVVPQFERFAVNLLSENESDLRPATTAPGEVGQTVDVELGQRRVEWWWWLCAAVALPLLIIEWIIYTRRLHG